MKNSFNPISRSQSLNALKHVRHKQIQTLAQKNLVTLKQPAEKYFINRPLRILLPDFFNIPKFIDRQIDFQGILTDQKDKNKVIQTFRQEKGMKKKLKDLSVLAQGMKRAKNIREQSRYYFIQGVILHNSGLYDKSVQMLQKFLKIVLFIKDQKSIQLALNSIGIAMMYLNKPQEALQYHQKQTQLNQNSQKFIGNINIALCYQMLSKKPEANQIYTYFIENQNINEKKLQYIQRLCQRTRGKDYQTYFLTQQFKNKGIHQSGQNTSNKHNHKQKQNMFYQGKLKQSHRNSPSNIKNLLNSSNKNSTQKLQFHNTSMLQNKKYENAKVNFAIFHAQQNLNNHLKNMKNSLVMDY